jgi:hypothetical protein
MACDPVEQEISAPSSLWQQLALAGVMLISIFMNFYQLGQNGFGNLYYASGVQSMLDNWHNFSLSLSIPEALSLLTSLRWVSGCK